MNDLDQDEMEAVFEALGDWIGHNSSELFPEASRKRKKKADLWKTAWGLWLKDPETQDPHTLAGKRFRLKFRATLSLI